MAASVMPKPEEMFCQTPCQHTDCANIRPKFERYGRTCTLGCGKPIEPGDAVFGWFEYTTDRPVDLRHAECAYKEAGL